MLCSWFVSVKMDMKNNLPETMKRLRINGDRQLAKLGL